MNTSSATVTYEYVKNYFTPSNGYHDPPQVWDILSDPQTRKYAVQEIIESYYVIDNNIQSFLLDLENQKLENFRKGEKLRKTYNITKHEYYHSTRSDILQLRFEAKEIEQRSKHHIETQHTADRVLINKVFDEILAQIESEFPKLPEIHEMDIPIEHLITPFPPHGPLDPLDPLELQPTLCQTIHENGYISHQYEALPIPPTPANSSSEL